MKRHEDRYRALRIALITDASVISVMPFTCENSSSMTHDTFSDAQPYTRACGGIYGARVIKITESGRS